MPTHRFKKYSHHREKRKRTSVLQYQSDLLENPFLSQSYGSVSATSFFAPGVGSVTIVKPQVVAQPQQTETQNITTTTETKEEEKKDNIETRPIEIEPTIEAAGEGGATLPEDLTQKVPHGAQHSETLSGINLEYTADDERKDNVYNGLVIDLSDTSKDYSVYGIYTSDPSQNKKPK